MNNEKKLTSYQRQVLAESDLLDVAIDTLCRSLAYKVKHLCCTECSEIALLQEQLDHMKGYKKVLNTRIYMFGVNNL